MVKKLFISKMLVERNTLFCIVRCCKKVCRVMQYTAKPHEEKRRKATFFNAVNEMIKHCSAGKEAVLSYKSIDHQVRQNAAKGNKLSGKRGRYILRQIIRKKYMRFFIHNNTTKKTCIHTANKTQYVYRFLALYELFICQIFSENNL